MIDLYCVRAAYARIHHIFGDLFMCSRNNKNTKQNRNDKRKNQWFLVYDERIAKRRRHCLRQFKFTLNWLVDRFVWMMVVAHWNLKRSKDTQPKFNAMPQYRFQCSRWLTVNSWMMSAWCVRALVFSSSVLFSSNLDWIRWVYSVFFVFSWIRHSVEKKCFDKESLVVLLGISFQAIFAYRDESSILRKLIIQCNNSCIWRFSLDSRAYHISRAGQCPSHTHTHKLQAIIFCMIGDRFAKLRAIARNLPLHLHSICYQQPLLSMHKLHYFLGQLNVTLCFTCNFAMLLQRLFSNRSGYNYGGR